jgi:hypothetical protein
VRATEAQRAHQAFYLRDVVHQKPLLLRAQRQRLEAKRQNAVVETEAPPNSPTGLPAKALVRRPSGAGCWKPGGWK